MEVSVNVPILRIPFSTSELDEISSGIRDVLASGMLMQGKNAAAFEGEMATLTGARHALATNSGTSALEIIFRALQLEDSSIIIPSNTFFATALAAIHAGARVIFADCSRDDLCIDVDDVARRIHPDTKAVVAVHIGGVISGRMQELIDLCERRGLYLIEDCAHAHGSTFNGRQAGTMGIAGAFSFFPTKVLTCAEGGIVTTGDESLYRRMAVLRDHGKEKVDGQVRHTALGYNWRISELHSVIATQQVRKAARVFAERRQIARWYDARLRDVPGISPLRMPRGVESTYYKYIVFLDPALDRRTIKATMKNDYQVSLTGEVYAETDVCHVQPACAKYPKQVLNAGDAFPNTDWVSRHHACLPLYPTLGESEVQHVVDSLKAVTAVVG